MIKDRIAKAYARETWKGVEGLREKLKRSAFASVGVGGSFPSTLANAAHNLPFIQAYAVLDYVLFQLAIEGRFGRRRLFSGRGPSQRGKRRVFLGRLLKWSRRVLQWQDFALVEAGVRDRNRVAHKSHLLTRNQCWKYVDAVKAELLAWGVL